MVKTLVRHRRRPPRFRIRGTPPAGNPGSRAPDLRLLFALPTTLAFAVRPGRFPPCLADCILTVDEAGQVAVTGPSREQVFAQAARWLAIVAREHPPASIAAV